MEWLRTLALIKQRKVVEDAELLVAAVKVVGDMPKVHEHHAALLTNQLVGILEAGLADGNLPALAIHAQRLPLSSTQQLASMILTCWRTGVPLLIRCKG